jgi:transcriptional regulator with XRE-family HTH domain
MTKEEYRAIRKQLGLTQAGLAKALGKSRATVENREIGKVGIDYEAELAISMLIYDKLCKKSEKAIVFGMEKNNTIIKALADKMSV